MDITRSIYFSHPIKSYGTEEEGYILRALAKEFSKVVNPRDFPPLEKPSNCVNCMEKSMKGHFFPMIEKCENFAIWMYSDTCGIECELHHAARIGKPIYMVELIHDPEEVDLEQVTLQEYNILRRYK